MANVTDHDFKATNRKTQKMKQNMRKNEKKREIWRKHRKGKHVGAVTDGAPGKQFGIGAPTAEPWAIPIRPVMRIGN